jgi:O-antigen ligase
MASVTLLVATVILLGIIASLSRMGFLAALVSLAAMGLLGAGAGWPRGKRWAVAAGIVAVALASFIFLPPDPLIARFAAIPAGDELPADLRVLMWRDTLGLIAAFPATGCGLGAFESAFFRYNVAAPRYTVDYAHNDYLQLLAELGIAGFVLLAVLMAAVWRRAMRGCAAPDVGERYRAVACAGALTAMLVHSLVDYNLYIPANALVFAWVCGMASSPVARAVRPVSGGIRLPVVIDVQPGI